MEVPRRGVESEVQLPQPQQCRVYITTDLHHSSWQHWIPNSVSKARDQTLIPMDTSRIRFLWATMGIPPFILYYCFPFSFPQGSLIITPIFAVTILCIYSVKIFAAMSCTFLPASLSITEWKFLEDYFTSTFFICLRFTGVSHDI